MNLLAVRSVIVLVMPTPAWTPPANPDLQKILSEARDDQREGKLDVALAKHVWFHENALKLAPSMYGVRLSFALSAWHELALVHPPAMEKLRAARDKAAEDAIAGNDRRRAFHDLVAINELLDEESLTLQTFRSIEKDNPNAAAEVIDLARPALVRAKQYESIARYLKPAQDFERMREHYRSGKEYEKKSEIAAASGFADAKFTNDVTTLVSILAVTGRANEAAEIAKLARSEWDDARFHAALDDALKGNVPPPWP